MLKMFCTPCFVRVWNVVSQSVLRNKNEENKILKKISGPKIHLLDPLLKKISGPKIHLLDPLLKNISGLKIHLLDPLLKKISGPKIHLLDPLLKRYLDLRYIYWTRC